LEEGKTIPCQKEKEEKDKPWST